MAERIVTGTDITLANGSNTNTQIGTKETFLDRNAKLIPSDETTTAITNMNWIAGHHTVKDLEYLYKIPDFILSQSCYADKVSKNGKDAIGQLWYVENDPGKGYYMLIKWDNRHNAAGWSKTNIKSLINEDGNSSTQYMNKDNVYDNIHSITVDGSDNHTYTGWTQGFKYTNNASTVTLSYTHYGDKPDSSINIPVLNSGNTITHTSTSDGSGGATLAGIVTADQYNSIMNRLKKLEEEVIWRSRIGVNGTNVLNGATYLWSGTLAQFNSLKSKPSNTTFIISN